MKKSLLFLILALSFTILSLTGCNRGGARNSAAEPTEAEIQAAIEAAQQILGGGTTAPTPTPTPTPVTTAPASGGPSTWTAVADSTFNGSEISAVAWGNNRFVAVGYEGKMSYSADGASWTFVANTTFGTSSTYDNIHAVAYGNGRFVAVGEGGKMAYCDW